MWTQEELTSQLCALGIRHGDSLLVISSLRSLGEIGCGASGVLSALLEAVGPGGNLLFPAFTLSNVIAPPEIDAEMSIADERLASALMTTFEAELTPVDTHVVGILPEIARRHPDAHRSRHPLYSFVALGDDAEFFVRSAPHHYPFGSESPLAKLFQKDGSVILLGTDYSTNIALHLAEIWARVPYTRRSQTYRSSAQRTCEMIGAPGCRAGFARLEPLMAHSRLQRNGTVAAAKCRLFAMRMAISLATAYLEGEPSGLLCRNPECPRCVAARKLCGSDNSQSNELQ